MKPLALESFTLANGLRVALHPRRDLPIVCLTIAYNVGSKDETPGRTGFAHLFEHLMFDGSANVPRGQFDRLCEAAGGHNNAYTHEDKTVYYMMLPAHQAELGLWLESDRLLALGLTEEGFETQRSVVMEEKLQRVDNQPYGTWETRMSELLYPGHPYGHPVIGSMEDLAAATIEDVADFHRAYYRPDNAALVLAGDFDTDHIARQVERWFGPIPSGTPRERIPLNGGAPAERARETTPDAVPLPGVFLGWRIPPERDDAFPAADLVSDVLGSGDTSRLHNVLVHERRIADQASAFVDARRGDSMLVAYASATQGVDAPTLEDALRGEIARLADKGVTDLEIRKLRNRVEALTSQQLQSLHSCADRIAHHALFDNDAAAVNAQLQRYLDVDAAKIREAARALHDAGRDVALHFIPDTREAAE